MNFGNILKVEREKQGLTKYRLAKMANVTETAIRYWESGERKMNIDSADKVFKALGVTVMIGANWEEKE